MKHKSPKDKQTQSRRGHPTLKKKAFTKKRAEVAEVCKEEGDFAEPEGGTDEEAAWTSETSDSHDEEETDQGNI